MSAVCASPADYLALRAANDNHIVSRPTQNRNSPSFQRVTIGNATADSRTDYVSGPNGALARIKKTAGLDTVTFIHADHLGTARAGTTTGGALVFEDFHTPFGESLIHPDATDNQGDYTGHIRDKATGLSYMQARYQDPLIGRFLSIDPVTFMDTGNPGYFNRYAYTFNDPINLIDPNGEAAITAGVEGQASVAGIGGGFSLKLAASVSRDPSKRLGFKAQGGLVVSGAVGAGTLGLKDPNLSVGEKALNLAIGLITDTGASAMGEIGGVIGTDSNPADVEDLGGNSVQGGVTFSKKAVTKNIPGPVGKAAGAAPGPELSLQFSSGNNGTRGIELGGGVAAGNPVFNSKVGTTLDGASSKAIVLKEYNVGL